MTSFSFIRVNGGFGVSEKKEVIFDRYRYI